MFSRLGPNGACLLGCPRASSDLTVGWWSPQPPPRLPPAVLSTSCPELARPAASGVLSQQIPSQILSRSLHHTESSPGGPSFCWPVRLSSRLPGASSIFIHGPAFVSSPNFGLNGPVCPKSLAGAWALVSVLSRSCVRCEQSLS